MTAWDIDRRRLIQGSLALSGLGLAGCTTPMGPRARLNTTGLAADDIPPPLAPVRAHPDRLFDITVCLRPFRAKGPRIEAEQIGDTLVVHNYGHGGSGWSLSWGSANLAIQKALVNSPNQVAVIGCGVIGLTSAIMAQRAGAAVTIYARDLLPQTRSSRATGSWTPDSRISLRDEAGPQFGELWEQMARFSFKTYRQYLGLPGTPVEWTDRYALSDIPFEQARAEEEEEERKRGDLIFGEYNDRIRDLTPRAQELPEGSTPFPVKYVRRSESMQFNVADYGHTLMSDFFTAGGKFVRKEFHAPNDLTQLKEKVVINCPGYAAREWWNDNSIVPVRGQISWLIPQPEVNYGFNYKNISILSRRDGIVVQDLNGGDMRGYNNSRELADRVEADNAVGVIAELYSRFRV
ncbi:MAG TPA: FAD-dependent oxidoreductase [Rhizomicrobium sp.]|jgi:glycine/D-amino acid oxidase-like deaminating enzyme|nr:FAD-dependent oxidoreductase [Rhizomicrobium sp.]